MPTLLPEQPDFASEAERRVCEALLAHLPEEATVLAGQRLTADGEEVEIDLLVLWPGIGVAVIEVKGGRVSVVDGEWRQADRTGSRRLHRSPVEQVQAAKHHLLRYLNSRSSQNLGRCVHLVALPYTHLPTDWDVPDAPRRLVLDETDLDAIAERLVSALQHESARHHGPLDTLQRDHTVKQLRRTHRAIENHQLLAREIEDEGNTLTREQERAVALLRFQRRAQVVGGAGSGKTHMALLKARALARAGLATALLCYSRGLARNFQLLTDTWPATERPAYVGLFHELPVSWGADPALPDAGPEHYEEHLPRELSRLAAARDPEDLFDAIVVDEAQDFSDLWWDAVRECLVDPEEGILYVFADDHQSVFDREGSAPITLNPFPLDDNLRNTGAIARTFAPLTPLAQLPRMDEGLPVRFVECATDDAVDRADDLVDPLLEEGWEPGDLALLTTGARHPVQRERIELDGYDGYWDEFFAGEDVFYGHVLNAKGLERRVVVLAVNGFRSAERAAHLLYVGLSRARSLLVVVGNGGEITAAGGADVLARIRGR